MLIKFYISFIIALVVYVIDETKLVLGKGENGDKSYLMIHGIRWADLLNPKKWYGYVDGRLAAKYLKPHRLEQYLIRQYKCWECVEAGKCYDCGCMMPEKTYALNLQCSKGKWGEGTDDPEEWEQLKQEFEIELLVKIKDKIYAKRK